MIIVTSNPGPFDAPTVTTKNGPNSFECVTAALKRGIKKGCIIRPAVVIVPQTAIRHRTYQRLVYKMCGTWWNGSLEESMNEVRDRWIHQRVWALSSPNFSGSLKDARFLMLGDIINQVYNWEHPPFYAKAGCVPFLNQCLDSVGVPEDELVWVNVNHRDMSIVNSIREWASHLKIIALGRQAEQKAAELGLPFSCAPHPQYGARFKRRDYARMLEGAFKRVS